MTPKSWQQTRRRYGMSRSRLSHSWNGSSVIIQKIRCQYHHTVCRLAFSSSPSCVDFHPANQQRNNQGMDIAATPASLETSSSKRCHVKWRLAWNASHPKPIQKDSMVGCDGIIKPVIINYNTKLDTTASKSNGRQRTPMMRW